MFGNEVPQSGAGYVPGRDVKVVKGNSREWSAVASPQYIIMDHVKVR